MTNKYQIECQKNSDSGYSWLSEKSRRTDAPVYNELNISRTKTYYVELI